MQQQTADSLRADEEDVALIERAAGGDRSALTRLYQRHASLLLAVGVRVLREREEAEDVLHDVFLEAWKKAATFDATRGTVRCWLLLRMRSRALDRLRAPRRARRVVLDDAAQDALEAAPAPEARLRGEGGALARALAALPEEQRRPLELVYFEGLSVAQAGERLSTPVGTMKSRMFAARAALRAALGTGGGA